jgi:hypothetical protein
MLRNFTCAILLLVTPTIAAADKILIVCGDSAAYSYFAEGGIAPSGWHKDVISPGQLSVIQRDSGQYDLLAAGVPGNNFYYSSGGCQINKLPSIRPNQLMFFAQCPQHAETFLFTWGANGTGCLLDVDIGVTALSTKATAFQSDCRLPK